MTKYLLWVLTTCWTILIWRLTTTPQIIVAKDFWLQNLLMMLAHFIFFGIQAVLLSFALPPSIWHLASSVSAVSLYGALIEFRQLTVPGRSGDPLDWLLDTLGAITFLLVLKKLQSKL
jgi:VanZ family protein